MQQVLVQLKPPLVVTSIYYDSNLSIVPTTCFCQGGQLSEQSPILT